MGSTPLKLLALETTGFGGSIALYEEHRLVAAYTLSDQQRSAQALAPAIERLLEQACWPIANVRAIAMTHGPGSFTGLRVGITTAKMLAFALGADLISIDTLELLAQQAVREQSAQRVHTVFDAQRQELFAATYLAQAGKLVREGDVAILPHAAWLAKLTAGDLVNGPPLAKLADHLPPGVMLASASAWQPNAVVLGAMAVEAWYAGERCDPLTLVPKYIRLSAAEEKAGKRLSSSG